MPVASLPVWQPKMSPDVIRCPHWNTGWKPLLWTGKGMMDKSREVGLGSIVIEQVGMREWQQWVSLGLLSPWPRAKNGNAAMDHQGALVLAQDIKLQTPYDYPKLRWPIGATSPTESQLLAQGWMRSRSLLSEILTKFVQGLWCQCLLVCAWAHICEVVPEAIHQHFFY